MTRMLRAALLTLGDPRTLTGGYLFHWRLAELAPHSNARMTFVCLPPWPFPMPIAAASRVMRLATRLPLDALVIDSIAAAYLAPWLERHAAPSPLLVMAHQPPGGIDYGPLRTRVQAALDRRTYAHVRHLMTASDDLAHQFIADGMPAVKLSVVPPGRDVATAATSGAAGDLRTGRSCALLCVGNWVARKGILDLLAAFAPLPADAATLHLVGRNDLEPAYARRVRARLSAPDLAGRVVYHGAVSRERVAALYAAADAFVLPSLKEPYGTVYGEAMAFGLPVIGWRAGNLPYLAADDGEGLLVPPGDIAGLSAALLRMARDEPLRGRLGAAARARATTRPTWEQTAARFFATIRDVVGEQPAR